MTTNQVLPHTSRDGTSRDDMLQEKKTVSSLVSGEKIPNKSRMGESISGHGNRKTTRSKDVVGKDVLSNVPIKNQLETYEKSQLKHCLLKKHRQELLVKALEAEELDQILIRDLLQSKEIREKVAKNAKGETSFLTIPTVRLNDFTQRILGPTANIPRINMCWKTANGYNDFEGPERLVPEDPKDVDLETTASPNSLIHVQGPGDRVSSLPHGVKGMGSPSIGKSSDHGKTRPFQDFQRYETAKLSMWGHEHLDGWFQMNRPEIKRNLNRNLINEVFPDFDHFIEPNLESDERIIALLNNGKGYLPDQTVHDFGELKPLSVTSFVDQNARQIEKRKEEISKLLKGGSNYSQEKLPGINLDSALDATGLPSQKTDAEMRGLGGVPYKRLKYGAVPYDVEDPPFQLPSVYTLPKDFDPHEDIPGLVKCKRRDMAKEDNSVANVVGSSKANFADSSDEYLIKKAEKLRKIEELEKDPDAIDNGFTDSSEASSVDEGSGVTHSERMEKGLLTSFKKSQKKQKKTGLASALREKEPEQVPFSGPFGPKKQEIKVIAPKVMDDEEKSIESYDVKIRDAIRKIFGDENPYRSEENDPNLKCTGSSTRSSYGSMNEDGQSKESKKSIRIDNTSNSRDLDTRKPARSRSDHGLKSPRQVNTRSDQDLNASLGPTKKATSIRIIEPHPESGRVNSDFAKDDPDKRLVIKICTTSHGIGELSPRGDAITLRDDPVSKNGVSDPRNKRGSRQSSRKSSSRKNKEGKRGSNDSRASSRQSRTSSRKSAKSTGRKSTQSSVGRKSTQSSVDRKPKKGEDSSDDDTTNTKLARREAKRRLNCMIGNKRRDEAYLYNKDAAYHNIDSSDSEIDPDFLINNKIAHADWKRIYVPNNYGKSPEHYSEDIQTHMNRDYGLAANVFLNKDCNKMHVKSKERMWRAGVRVLEADLVNLWKYTVLDDFKKANGYIASIIKKKVPNSAGKGKSLGAPLQSGGNSSNRDISVDSVGSGKSLKTNSARRSSLKSNPKMVRVMGSEEFVRRTTVEDLAEMEQESRKEMQQREDLQAQIGIPRHLFEGAKRKYAAGIPEVKVSPGSTSITYLTAKSNSTGTGFMRNRNVGEGGASTAAGFLSGGLITEGVNRTIGGFASTGRGSMISANALPEGQTGMMEDLVHLRSSDNVFPIRTTEYACRFVSYDGPIGKYNASNRVDGPDRTDPMSKAFNPGWKYGRGRTHKMY